MLQANSQNLELVAVHLAQVVSTQAVKVQPHAPIALRVLSRLYQPLRYAQNVQVGGSVILQVWIIVITAKLGPSPLAGMPLVLIVRMVPLHRRKPRVAMKHVERVLTSLALPASTAQQDSIQMRAMLNVLTALLVIMHQTQVQR